MSILDLHGDDLAAARPRFVQPRPPVTSVWQDIGGALSAVPRGISSAAAEVMGTTAEIVAGYGDVMGRIESGESLQTRQPDMQSDFGDALRERGREFKPDPQTAGAAEQVVYGFARGAAKIVGGAVVAGPAGVLAAGVEEGYTQRGELIREGVDPTTATQVGAVQGAGLALAALPAAGTTLAGTAALYLAGGPGGYIAQQALTREILQRGGYDQRAAETDPFDPVGLAVASLVPAPFAVLGLRAARLRSDLSSEIDAQSYTAPRMPEQTPLAAALQDAYPREVQDAARVMLLQQHRADTNPTRPADPATAPDPAAAAAHEAALTRAEEQIAAGERVNVGDIAASEPTRYTEALQSIRDRVVSAARGVTEAMIAKADEIRAFIAGPAKDVRDSSTALNFAVVTDDVSRRIEAETGVVIAPGAYQELRADAARHAQKRHPDLTPEDWATLPWLAENFQRAVLLKQEPADQGPRIALAAIDPATGVAYVAEYRAGRKKGERLGLVTFFRGNPSTVENYLRTNGRPRKGGDDGGGGNGSTPDAPVLPSGPEALTSETSSGGSAIIPREGAAGPSTTPGAAAESSAVDARIAQIEADMPDLQVMLDGMDAPMPMREFLQRVRAEADAEIADAPLYEVAAACALTFGAAPQ